MTPSQDLVLPLSNAKDPPRTALMVEVTSSAVMVEGKVVVTMDDIVATDSLVVPRLFDWLSGMAVTFKDPETRHEAVIQCDKNCDFKYLKKVMATCARASFSNFTLLVMQKG
ncbi:MAG: hypothetical protein A2487_16250 [Candidatus Raymondbacteria bacterium RifOxyC12_full_50_8]|nr:MAG: hypothetical protein A2487_16250 [Candidatus Raymondbacteria bacterium RifOxyC12_full_50_8]